jgi:hypothetical protein
MSYQINTTTTTPISIGTKVSTSTTKSLTINSTYDTSTRTPVYINTSLSSSTSQKISFDVSRTTCASDSSISPVLNGNITINVSTNLIYYSEGNNVSIIIKNDDVSNSTTKSFDGVIQSYDASKGELKINQIQNIVGSPFPSKANYSIMVTGSGSIEFYLPQHLLYYAPGNSITITNSDSSDTILSGKIKSYDYETGLIAVNQINPDDVITSFTSKVSTNIDKSNIAPTYLPLTLNVSSSLLYYCPGNYIKITDSTEPDNYLDGTIESYDYDSGSLLVSSISSSIEFQASQVFNLSVTPKNSRIPMFISPGLTSYKSGNPVTIVQKASGDNYLNGYIQSYDSVSGKIVFDNIQNINGLFEVLSDNYINISLILGGSISLQIQKGLSFNIRNTVYISDSTNSSNNFAGFAEEYSFGTGLLIINNIQNINGSFVSPVIYNVSLSTPIPVNTTQAYKSVSVPIIPAPTASYYPNDSQTPGYAKFGWNSKTSLNNPVKGVSLGQSIRAVSLPRRSSVLY